MDIETLNKANSLMGNLREIDGELKAWADTTSPTHLGMKQHWNNGHLVQLPCKHSPRSAFDSYRDSCINALKVKRAEIESEIAGL